MLNEPNKERKLYNIFLFLHAKQCKIEVYIESTFNLASLKFMILHIIQICSGITRGRVLSGELYVQRLQKLIYLHLPTDCFMKISLQSTGLLHVNVLAATHNSF